MEFLIVCPLVFLAGLIDAIAGGGGLISLPAYFFAGLPAHAALATSKLSSTMGTTVATIKFALRGYMIKKYLIAGVIFGLAGSFIGSNLVLIASNELLMIFMLLSLPAVGFFVLKTKDLDDFADHRRSERTAMLLVSGISFTVGIYDGLYGPGTGTFLLLLLTSVAHLSMREAAGTAKAINLATNISALVVFLLSGNVVIILGLVAGLFNIAGNWIGANLFHKKGSAIVRPILVVVLILFALKLLYDLFA